MLKIGTKREERRIFQIENFMINYERIKLNKDIVLLNLKQSKSLPQFASFCKCGKDKIRTFVKENGLYKEYCKQFNLKYKKPIIYVCEICENDKSVKKLNGHYYCKKHYNQIYRKGHTYNTIYDRNEYKFKDDLCYIILKNRHQKIIGECIIDKKYYNKIKDLKWYLSGGYCVTKSINKDSGTDISNIMFNNYNVVYDHIDNNRLNNTKINLRIVTHQQNAMNMGLKFTNTSGVVGVSKQKKKENNKREWTGKWYSVITHNYKNMWLGSCNNFNDAVELRILAESKYFKQYSPNYNTKRETIYLEYISNDDNKKYFIEADLEENIIKKGLI